jgi:hypothetical protein
LARFNREFISEMLFANVQATLKEVARRQCGLTEIGYLAVLHTWGQRLQPHVHLHLIVAGGGLTDNGRWKTLSENFFLPVEILRAVFRAKMLQAMLEAYEAGKLNWVGPFAYLANWQAFSQFYGQLLQKEWVVHIKPPVHGDPDIVLKYLARYVYRTAISNHRLLKLEGDQVTFSYKDYAEAGSPEKEMQVSAEKLLDLFLQHVSPRGFKRIRYVGFWSGPRASQRITAIRHQLAGEPDCQQCDDPSPNEKESAGPTERAFTTPTCPHCESTDLQLIEECSRADCGWMWSFKWEVFPSWPAKIEDTS